MKVKLYLHGHLRNKIQKDFVEVEALTVLDALRNLEMNYRKILKAPYDIGRWKIRIKDFETKVSWTVPLFVNELHIYPVFRMGKSSGSGGLIQTVIGATMVAVGLTIAYGAGWTGIGGYVGLSIASFGLSLFTQGILSLFFTPTNETDNTNSKYLGSGQNTTKSGTRIPIGYGLFKVAGQILSYNISSSNIRIYGE